MKIITNKVVSSKTQIYEKIKAIKWFSKDKNEILFKFFIQCLLNVLSCFVFFENLIYKFKLKKYQSYNIFFSPIYKIPSAF